MRFPLIAALVFTAPVVVLAAVVGLGLWFAKRPQRRYWRFVLWLVAGLFPVNLLVTFPMVLGWFASRQIDTRRDERAYTGPRLDADGRLLVQDRKSLRAEAEAGRPAVAAATLAAAAARAQFVASSDGVTVRTFRIEPRQEPPVAVAVLVHGLFRSAMELEPVAAMLHERGCECWLVELRNHGRSGRAPFTGGLRESDDVVAVVEHVRRQPDRAHAPLLLFGVSLGTVAVAYALPRIDGVAGVVLDAPIDDLTAAAHRMMTFHRPGDPRSNLYMCEPWRSSILTSLGAWSDFRVRDVAAGDVLATLPHDLPVLLIGEGDDDRAPPESVERLFERLPMPAPLKELWLVPGEGHGTAFVHEPAAYDAALGRFLARLRACR